MFEIEFVVMCKARTTMKETTPTAAAVTIDENISDFHDTDNRRDPMTMPLGLFVAQETIALLLSHPHAHFPNHG